MKSSRLAALIADSFSFAALEDALLEAVGEVIDYHEIAESIVAEHGLLIEEIIREQTDDFLL